MGWRRVAEQELALLEPETRDRARGVRRRRQRLPRDRAARRESPSSTPCSAPAASTTEPEPWTPVDSLAWLKAMAWDLRGNMADEIDRALALADHTPERGRRALPAVPLRRSTAPIVEQGAVVDGVFEQDADRGGDPATRSGRRTPPARRAPCALGRCGRRSTRCRRSSAAATASAATPGWSTASTPTTGAPLLANDPHLGVSLPGVWMQVGLHCRTRRRRLPARRRRASRFSGVPGVIIGHNADIAWGFTNLGPDVTDLYLERVVGDRWRHDGRLRPLRTRQETIEVRDGDDVDADGPLDRARPAALRRLRRPRRGRRDGADRAPRRPARRRVRRRPRVDRPRARRRPPTRSSRSTRPPTGTTSGPPPRSSRSPRRTSSTPTATGHIGYQAPGRIPIRKSGNDGVPPGRGLARRRRLDRRLRPVRRAAQRARPRRGLRRHRQPGGRRARTTPTSSTDDWDHGYRAQRIRDLLEDEGELSVAEMARAPARRPQPAGAPTLVPDLLDLDAAAQLLRRRPGLLRGWDFTQPADSAAAAYFNVVWRNLLELTFHDELPGGHRGRTAASRWVAVVTELLDATRPTRGGTTSTTDDVVETRDDILRQAMRDARDELTRLQALDRRATGPGAACTGSTCENQTLGQSGIGAGRVAGQPRPLGGRRRRAPSSTRPAWDAAEGYEVDQRAVDADGRVAGRPRRLPLGQPHRRLRARVQRRTTPTRPTSGPTGETLPWAFSPRTRSRPRPRTRSPCSRPTSDE